MILVELPLKSYSDAVDMTILVNPEHVVAIVASHEGKGECVVLTVTDVGDEGIGWTVLLPASLVQIKLEKAS